MEVIITITKVYKNLNFIIKRVKKGDSFLVTRYSKPLFRIVPVELKKEQDKKS